MTFDQWMTRPVYKAQVAAFRRAKELCGIDPSANFITKGASHVLCGFHALPGQRNQYSQALRNMVALSLRMDRFNARRGKP